MFSPPKSDEAGDANNGRPKPSVIPPPLSRLPFSSLRAFAAAAEAANAANTLCPLLPKSAGDARLRGGAVGPETMPLAPEGVESPDRPTSPTSLGE